MLTLHRNAMSLTYPINASIDTCLLYAYSEFQYTHTQTSTNKPLRIHNHSHVHQKYNFLLTHVHDFYKARNCNAFHCTLLQKTQKNDLHNLFFSFHLSPDKSG